ncbi:YaaA family protein [Candidatus Mycoplasma mahonii]|uniref:YaaA family protein n=1 Tax=Candidatus Mycoplasma mahonii TaxID=3004105 RepID=UPI0026E9DD41|nr:YaaA family protein [Candidatus Mycoplasma mahonii]WKX02435.1 YaaA family protein [Candidatus Mycoplasma mahonii]
MKYKIIISPSKNINRNASAITKDGSKPLFLIKAKEVFRPIRKLDLAQTKKLYGLSDKKSLEVYDMHQKHGENNYYAIEYYGGLFYQRLDLTDKSREWLQEHVVIVDALYGLLRPYDRVSEYRLDFTIKFPFNLRAFWKEDINKYFECYEVYNLASKEFSSMINKKLIEVPLSGEGNIKIQRAEAFNKFKKD